MINKKEIDKAISCGNDDEKNYYCFYTGMCYEQNSIKNIIAFAREKFPSFKNLMDEEIQNNHIYWATESSQYKGMYNGDEYILFEDIDKLPEDMKIDAINANCSDLSMEINDLEDR